MTDARTEIGKALEGKLTKDQLDLLMNEVLAITKSAWANCPHCKKKSKFEIPDAKAVTGAVIDLANQAWGRPDVAQMSDDEKITFIREVRM